MAQEKKFPVLQGGDAAAALGLGATAPSLGDKLASLEGEDAGLTDADTLDELEGAVPPPLPGAPSGAALSKPIAGPPPIDSAAAATGIAGSRVADQSQGRVNREPVDEDDDVGEADGGRRAARRRPAGPVRERIAANDDAPSIGGLIYALEQSPSSKPFKVAGIASAVWVLGGLGLGWLSVSAELSGGATFADLVIKPQFFLTIASIVVPVAVIWFLAMLAWRAEELRLRSSTMTEVAIRLAEPDRMAEQSVASLGQAVRRQVSFMNDAVSRALGRAGELEALVHNEVSALERSYEENERKIRGLIDELSGERFALLDTGGKVEDTLRSLGTEIPALIEKLSGQQTKLAGIIQGAGDNLTALENSLGSRSEQLQVVLEDYTGALDTAMDTRTQQMQGMLIEHTEAMGSTLNTQNDRMQGMLETYTGALATALGSRTDEMQSAFEEYLSTLDTSIADRTDNLQTVFEEYAKALDSTLATRAQALDAQLVDRTRALDEAFAKRLELFDDAILRSTSAIDEAVGERASALTNALDSHAVTFKETITQQAADLDESLVHGISAVRRSSENITRQSIKAIEGLASQSEMLKNVSENLLAQINTVTNRFDNQGQTILRAASSLESANYKIDVTLRNRHTELSDTLGRLSDKAQEFGQFIEGYSSSIEGSLTDAEKRARLVAEELKLGTQAQQQAAMQDMERFRSHTDAESQRTLSDLRQRFSSVSDEVSSQLGSLTNRVDETTQEVRDRTRKASEEIAAEQAKLRSQLETLPNATQESSEAMRRLLQDQLKALEQLSNITSREARGRDISRSEPSTSRPTGPGAIAGPTPAPRSAKPDGGLSSLSTSLARELAQRPVPNLPPSRGAAGGQAPSRSHGHEALETGSVNVPDARGQAPSGGAQRPGLPRPSAPASQQSLQGVAPRGGVAPQQRGDDSRGENWSLGDLLKRASLDDEASSGAPVPQGAAQAQPSNSRNGSGGIDIGVMGRALDPATASGIWARLRAGQSNVMVRSLYSPEGQALYDELSHRHAHDAGLQETVTRYLAQFEQTLKDAEQRDPSGELVSQHLVADTGRVYLFLAHVSGRLG